MDTYISVASRNIKNFFVGTNKAQIQESFHNSLGARIILTPHTVLEGEGSGNLDFSDVYNFISPRREFRHAYVGLAAAFIWGIVESIILVIAAILATPFDRERKIQNLAKESVIQCASNGAIATISFIGQFAPALANRGLAQLNEFVSNGISRYLN